MTSLATDLLRINGHEPWPKPAPLKGRGRTYLLMTGPELDEERKASGQASRERATVLRLFPRERAKAMTYQALEAVLVARIEAGDAGDTETLRKIIASRLHWKIRKVGARRPYGYWLDWEASQPWVQRLIGKL